MRVNFSWQAHYLVKSSIENSKEEKSRVGIRWD